jgi:adenylate kinase
MPPDKSRRMVLHFIGGGHGAGKSTLCKALAPLVDAEHVRASALIQRGIGEPPSNDEKHVASIDRNQATLVAELRKSTTHRVLLDGHFVLLAQGGAISPIPLEIFAAMNPTSFVVVNTATTTTVERLTKRDSRHVDSSAVQSLREAELDHASLVASQLQRPLLVVDSGGDMSSVAQFLRSAETK